MTKINPDAQFELTVNNITFGMAHEVKVGYRKNYQGLVVGYQPCSTTLNVHGIPCRWDGVTLRLQFDDGKFQDYHVFGYNGMIDNQFLLPAFNQEFTHNG